MASESEIWRIARELTEELGAPAELAPEDALDELEKQQLFIEHDRGFRPDGAPVDTGLTPAQLAILGVMRKQYPSSEDVIWGEVFSRR